MAGLPLGSPSRPLRVAIVGSGPSAFYAAEALFKVGGLSCRCDVFDRLPTPYGLVRGGVAPDHQKIKAVVKVYEKIAADAGFRFFGNVRVGRDLSVAELERLYDRVIWAVGNESDRKLGIPGEELAGVHSATAFVGWYNGHPDHQSHRFDLERTRRAVVVGNGNVAMDVTRVLLQDPDVLATTDITEEAVALLRRSGVQEVVLLGRRGAAQAAFSTKEIEEIAELGSAALEVPAAEIANDPVSEAWLASGAPRAALRNLEFLREHAAKPLRAAKRRARTLFCASPVEVLGEAGRVRGIRVERNALVPEADGTPRAKGTKTFFEIDCELVLAAVGYRGVPVPGLPFDERSGTIPNSEGRVLVAAGGGVLPRHYVVGWAKRGPSGLIGTNSPDSKATVEALVADLATANAEALPAEELEAMPRLLGARGVDFVSFADWKLYDAWEQLEGKRRNKVRHKLSDPAAILAVIREIRGAGA
ncbi:MAG: FAD-dependent oxidoreductase [Planctomycetes bacterium]|nr:FAD-dependent oxidoreductase [Planctomycetota bacterium]